MKTRQQHIEFDRNYCAHYEPKPGLKSKQDWCAIGCGSSGRMKSNDGWAPCIGGHKHDNVLSMCPKWERRSLEHAEKRADQIQAAIENLTIVMPVVAKWKTWTEENRVSKQGVIECPKCKGKLHLSQAAYNGHVWGKCETEGCVSWMQ